MASIKLIEEKNRNGEIITAEFDTTNWKISDNRSGSYVINGFYKRHIFLYLLKNANTEVQTRDIVGYFNSIDSNVKDSNIRPELSNLCKKIIDEISGTILVTEGTRLRNREVPRGIYILNSIDDIKPDIISELKESIPSRKNEIVIESANEVVTESENNEKSANEVVIDSENGEESADEVVNEKKYKFNIHRIKVIGGIIAGILVCICIFSKLSSKSKIDTKSFCIISKDSPSYVNSLADWHIDDYDYGEGYIVFSVPKSSEENIHLNDEIIVDINEEIVLDEILDFSEKETYKFEIPELKKGVSLKITVRFRNYMMNEYENWKIEDNTIRTVTVTFPDKNR